MERTTGIEPASSAWEADVLPINYVRNANIISHLLRIVNCFFYRELPPYRIYGGNQVIKGYYRELRRIVRISASVSGA